MLSAEAGSVYFAACPRCYGSDLESISEDEFNVRRADRPEVNQLLHELEAMKDEGYSDVDIVLALRRKYPYVAHKAISVAREKGLLDV